MITRCKMRCVSRLVSEGSRQVDGTWKPAAMETIEFTAVVEGSEENKAFWSATPSGSLKFQCVYPESVSQFEVGKEYFIDISIAGPLEVAA